MSDTNVELGKVLGTDRVRDGAEADAVDGVTPRWVATVEGTEQVAEAMRLAAAHDLRVIAKGSGSKLNWAAPPTGVDLLLDLSPTTGVIEHAAGDLVVRAKSGTPLADVHRTVAEAGQQLAIDQPFATATVGGTIATGLSGPCRHYFGGVRDLLIGITVVLADGTIATSGGKVVKNVAGYDLGKLYTGSFGTLGVITEAIFRLHPRAAEHRWLVVTTDAVGELLAALRRSQAMPTAVELNQSEPATATVCVQLEGRPDVTHERTQRLAESVQPHASSVSVLEHPPEWWGGLPFESDGIGLRLGSSPAALPRLLESLFQANIPSDGVTVRGAVGLGVVHVGLPAELGVPEVVEFVQALRKQAEYVVIERAPAGVLSSVDCWGELDAGVLRLMRRLKDQFDPEHRLAPGRFVGGI